MPLSIYRPAYSSTPPKGSGFTNLQTYLQANRDNRLGQAVGGGIQKEAAGVQSQLGTAQTEFQRQAEQNRLGTQQDIQARQQILSQLAPPSATATATQAPTTPAQGTGPNVNPGAGPNAPTTTQPINAPGNTLEQQPTITPNQPTAAQLATGIKNQLMSIPGSVGMSQNPEISAQMNPAISKSLELGQQLQTVLQGYNPQLQALTTPTQEVAPTLTDEQIARFQRMAAGQYAGPTDIAGIQDIASRAQATGQLGQDVSSQAGRLGLVQRYAANPLEKYGLGQAQLDQLLLGQATPQLTQARQAALGLTSDVTRAQSAAQAKAADLAAKAAAFGTETGTQLTSAKQASESDIQNSFLAAQIAEQKRQQAENDIQSILRGENLPEVKDASGNVIRQAGPATGASQQQQILNVLTSQGLLNQNQLTELDKLAQINAALNAPTSSIADVTGVQRQLAGTSGATSGPLGWQTLPQVGTEDKLRPYLESGGFNFNQLLQKSMQDQAAQNLSAESVASTAQRARANLLSQLGGGTQVYNPSASTYQRGLLGPDVGSILSQIQARVPTQNAWLTQDTQKNINDWLEQAKAANPTSAAQYANVQANLDSYLATAPDNVKTQLQDPNVSQTQKEQLIKGLTTNVVSGQQAALNYLNTLRNL